MGFLVRCALLLFLALFTNGTGTPTKPCPSGCFSQVIGTRTIGCNCCNNVDANLTSPCAGISCSRHQRCVLHQKSCDLRTDPLCLQISLEAKCESNCRSIRACNYNAGCHLVHDARGCKFCYCNKDFTNGCKSHKGCGSNPGQICKLYLQECNTYPCYPVAQCHKLCYYERPCPHGCLKYVDNDGCSSCHCCNECVGHFCQPDEFCVLQMVKCVQGPCLPVARCLPKNDEKDFALRPGVSR